DRAMLRRPHQPGAGPLRHTRRRPLLEGGNQGVLRELLGRLDVAEDPGQPGDEPCRLDPPDRLDRAIRLPGCRLRGVLLVRIYGGSSVTCPPYQRSDAPRRFRHRMVPFSATRWPRPLSAPATASIP